MNQADLHYVLTGYIQLSVMGNKKLPPEVETFILGNVPGLKKVNAHLGQKRTTIRFIHTSEDKVNTSQIIEGLKNISGVIVENFSLVSKGVDITQL